MRPRDEIAAEAKPSTGVWRERRVLLSEGTKARVTKAGPGAQRGCHLWGGPAFSRDAVATWGLGGGRSLSNSEQVGSILECACLCSLQGAEGRGVTWTFCCYIDGGECNQQYHGYTNKMAGPFLNVANVSLNYDFKWTLPPIIDIKFNANERNITHMHTCMHTHAHTYTMHMQSESDLTELNPFL